MVKEPECYEGVKCVLDWCPDCPLVVTPKCPNCGKTLIKPEGRPDFAMWYCWECDAYFPVGRTKEQCL